ncbi:alpha/beta hydrolase-fold protein [uncultured Polaribacter sp.]|uniref:alpha/beta hydrolase-fold protein n=1 Tax=uncultured Polaribacter sp. TaxID=174711 RepID=UPI0026241139|nr:alpha/beta hydrolase-fold protein [uncultured Polaribacter sp.]
MIKKSFSLIFTLFCLSGFSQKIIEKQITSDFLESKRDLKIYLPKGYEKDSLKNYPLTIVFDEGYLFDIYTGNAKLFAAKDKAPKQIIVGVALDKKKDTYFNVNDGRLTASNNAFYQFIKDEVIFFMESNYKTSPFISLVGEGTAANLITHYLKEANPFINTYICINPIFSDFIGQQLESYRLLKFQKQDNSFYLYINNATSFSTTKQTKIGEIQKALSLMQMKNFKVINDTINTPSSISAIAETVPRVMTKIFEIYAAITKEEFETKIKDLSPDDAIAYLENKYLEIEFLFGTNLGIRPQDIYAIEDIIIEKENGDKLRDFGKMILKLFPSSPLGDYYIGRYYETGNQTKKALKYYKIGYGKMDPADPNSDAFYENILRLGGE